MTAREYLLQVLAPALLMCAAPTLLLVWIMQQRPPTNWLDLIAYAGMFAAGCGVTELALARRSWAATGITSPQYDAA